MKFRDRSSIYRVVPVLMILVSRACFEYHEIQCALSIVRYRDIFVLKAHWLHQSLTDITIAEINQPAAVTDQPTLSL